MAVGQRKHGQHTPGKFKPQKKSLSAPLGRPNSVPAPLQRTAITPPVPPDQPTPSLRWSLKPSCSSLLLLLRLCRRRSVQPILLRISAVLTLVFSVQSSIWRAVKGEDLIAEWSSVADLMAVRSMEMLAVGSIGRELAGLEARRGEPVVVCAKLQRVLVSVKVENRWPPAGVVARPAGLRRRATSGDGQPTKNYDVNEVVEKVVHEEKNQLPQEEKKTPDPLPEGEPSPFSPAIETDDTDTFQGEGVSKDSLVEPPRGLQEGAASASIGEGLGASEESALSADIAGIQKSGSGGNSLDWRVHLPEDGCLSPQVEKAVGTKVQPEKQKQMFGPSEASCDEGSSFLAEAGILENDGGKSVDDYKLRADIFSKSADLFSALKNRESNSVV